MNNNHGNEQDERVVCFDCGSSDVAKAIRQQKFQYGEGESAVELSAEMAVYTCKECGYQFAGADADEARHESVCRYLGVLTPSEIVAIRESTGLSRAEFCDLTRIGIASLKRWETGSLIQNAANDELLFLAAFPENVKRLRERDRCKSLMLPALTPGPAMASTHRSPQRFRGRCLTPDSDLEECSRVWPLRVVVAA